MISTTHILIGAVLGKNISNPWIIVIVAIPLHFLLDHFRQGEYVESFSKKTSVKNTWWKSALDLFVGIVIIFAIAYYMHFSSTMIKLIAIGMFFSILPDLLNVLYWEFHWPFLKKIHDFHAWCHKYPPLSKEREWTLRNGRNDIIFSIIAIIFLII